ncbi:hypothetical protein RXV86_08525 [Alisedimentitalea sp. MJ-SS2]|uniref:hypothetical protein n=1 Tax=Aliisedimentitalea sp. MJ-SS2 TaxID=3049795 RepID=UPI00290BE61B|nr:hypothetical protein [Alisedimentitalea sp. MJ-SS2]MDU8927426.1 hypothetical protein [Alisedimentitalea sp. MJ-SS2]
MIRNLIASSALILAVALPAQAEQFAVKLDAAYEGANAKLMESLKISAIESFSQNGAHFVVLDAPNDAYVEAFILAIGRDAIELNAIDADWSNPVMVDLSISQRLGFLRSIECDFCTS